MTCAEAGRGSTQVFRNRLPPGEPRILVIDDEPSVVQLLPRELEHLGVRVDCVGNPRTAIADLDLGGVALVVLELAQPRVCGLRVLEWLSARAPDTPILIVVGPQGAPAILARFPNVVRVVSDPPVSVDVLRDLISTYVGSGSGVGDLDNGAPRFHVSASRAL